MRLFDLLLRHIGPFEEAALTFIGEKDDQKRPPVTIITGENGTGKTIILDAVRAMFLGTYGNVERDIVRDFLIFSISLTIVYKGKQEELRSSGHNLKKQLFINENTLNPIFSSSGYKQFRSQKNIDWIVDYWTSNLSSETFEIKSITSPDPEKFPLKMLSGIRPAGK